MLGLGDYELVKPWLLPGERPLWVGRPPRGLALLPGDRFMIPFSLMWSGIAIVWNLMAWAMDTPLFFRLFGLPFLLIGFYLLVLRFFVDAWRRGRTVYAVTDRRILFIRTGAGGRVTSLDIDALPGLVLTERRDGRGTIRFEPPAPPEVVEEWGRRKVVTRLGGPSFDEVENVRSVYELVRRQVDRARYQP
jgi:hypothetical protein